MKFMGTISTIKISLTLSSVLLKLNYKNIFTVLTLSQTTNLRLFHTGSLQTTISGLIEIAESSPNGLKTLQEKEKLLVKSNFSFS